MHILWSTYINTKRSPSQCRASGMEFLCLRHGAPFYGYSEKPPHLVAFYDTMEGPGGWVENVHLRIPSVIVKGD